MRSGASWPACPAVRVSLRSCNGMENIVTHASNQKEYYPVSLLLNRPVVLLSADTALLQDTAVGAVIRDRPVSSMPVPRIGEMGAGCWRRSCAAVVAISAVLALAGCSHGSQGKGAASSDFLRLGTIAALNSLNPWVTTDQLSLDLQSDIYPRLIQYNLSTMNFEPDFATSWKQSGGGLIFTFTTVPHARWSDGTPLTAKDAAWTINTMVRLRNGAAAL